MAFSFGGVDAITSCCVFFKILKGVVVKWLKISEKVCIYTLSILLFFIKYSNSKTCPKSFPILRHGGSVDWYVHFWTRHKLYVT